MREAGRDWGAWKGSATAGLQGGVSLVPPGLCLQGWGAFARMLEELGPLSLFHGAISSQYIPVHWL